MDELKKALARREELPKLFESEEKLLAIVKRAVEHAKMMAEDADEPLIIPGDKQG